MITVFNPSATRVVLGAGAVASLPEELKRLGLRQVLVVTTPGRAAVGVHLVDLIGPAAAGLHPHAAEHVPSAVVANGVAAAREAHADGLLAVGGGSSVGLTKAIARETGLPQVVVPTTYSGSEMTSVWGITTEGVKATGRDLVVVPRTVVYDPELTTDLPPRTSLTSGVNAMAHAVEASYAHDRNPLVEVMASESVRLLRSALLQIVDDPGDLVARLDALTGSWLAGTCLSMTTMGLHHQLCHILGGTFGLSHADTHTVLLPHVLAFNMPHLTGDVLTSVFGQKPARAMRDLVATGHGPLSLREIGMPGEGIDAVVQRVLANPYPNPRPAGAEQLHDLLLGAWSGDLP